MAREASCDGSGVRRQNDAGPWEMHDSFPWRLAGSLPRGRCKTTRSGTPTEQIRFTCNVPLRGRTEQHRTRLATGLVLSPRAELVSVVRWLDPYKVHVFVDVARHLSAARRTSGTPKKC